MLNSIVSIASEAFPNTISAPDANLSMDYDREEDPGPSTARVYANTRIKQEVVEFSEFDEDEVRFG